MHRDGFWQRLDSLVAAHRIRIERPRGSSDPDLPDFVYPADYGYLEGTGAPDGAGIDVWVGSVRGGGVTGLICTVDIRKSDAEMKLLVGCTEEEMSAALAAHNRGLQSGILLHRSARETRYCSEKT